MIFSTDNDRKRRAQAAASRKAKVLAQMNQMQQRFAKTFETELASMDTTEINKSDTSSKQKSSRNNFQAVGPKKSMPEIHSKIYTCILCQEDDCVDRNTLVYATYIGKLIIWPKKENSSLFLTMNKYFWCQNFFLLKCLSDRDWSKKNPDQK